MLKLKIILFGTDEMGNQVLMNGETRPLRTAMGKQLYENIKKEMTRFLDRVV